MRNITAKVLLLFLALSIFLCSCGAETAEEIFDAEFVSSGSGYDLEGYEIKYIIGSDDSFLRYEADTYFYDMAKKRVDDVENALNCKVNIVSQQSNDSTAMMTATAGGLYYGDAFSWAGDMLLDAAAAGLLVGLSTVSEYLDIKDGEKWGNKYQLESICYKDDVYGFIPYLWSERSYSEMGYFLTINEDIVKKLAQTDPREYVENGTWVWQQFRDCLEPFTLTEGAETTVYALPGIDGNAAIMYLMSNGNHLVEISPTGEKYNGLNDDKAMQAMQEATEVRDAYAHTFSNASGSNNIVSEFVSGKLSMAIFNSNDLLGKVAYQTENFGIVKWPTGPSVSPDYAYSFYSNITPTCISVLSPDPGATALILDRIYEPFEGFETQKDIHDYMRSSVFFDERDCNTFFDMVENTRYNYFHFSVYGYLASYISANLTPAQSVEALDNQLSSVFDEHIVPCIEGILSVYGSYGD